MLPWPVDSLGFLEQVRAYMFNFCTWLLMLSLHKSISVVCIDDTCVLRSQVHTGSQSHVVH